MVLCNFVKHPLLLLGACSAQDHGSSVACEVEKTGLLTSQIKLFSLIANPFLIDCCCLGLFLWGFISYHLVGHI